MTPDNTLLAEAIQRENPYYSNITELPNGQLACLNVFAFTVAILSGLTRHTHQDRWCYHDKLDAQEALEQWVENFDKQVEPIGWHRHPATGRRFREDGTMYIHY